MAEPTPRQEVAQRRVHELLAELGEKDFVTVLPAGGMLNHHAVGLLCAALAFADHYGPAGGVL